MSKMFQVYGIGQALIPVLPPPLPFESAPTSNQTNYEIGQVVFTPPTAPTAFYMYGGGGNWVQLADSDGPIESVLGTANQVTVNTLANVATVSLPSAITTPGSLTTTTTLAAGTSFSAGTTMTAGTGITSTSGNITATNGNLVLGTAGNKIVSTSVGSGTSAGANSFGTVTLTGGTATVATTAVTASSIIMLTRQSPGATGANPLGMISVGTITPSTSFVINALTTADSSTNVATDVSVVGWMIIN